MGYWASTQNKQIWERANSSEKLFKNKIRGTKGVYRELF